MTTSENILTEVEAKDRWCPFARVLDVYRHPNAASFVPPFNREVGRDGFTAPNASKCIGSACMAWQWRGTHVNDTPGAPMKWADRTYGYCGAFSQRADQP